MNKVTENGELGRSPVPGRIWFISVLACSCTGIAGVLWGWPLIFLPFILFGILACLFNSTWGLYILVLSLFLPYPFLPGSDSYPVDFITVLIIGGFWLRRLAQGRIGFVRTPIDIPIVLWLGLLGLSLVGAYDPMWGLVHWRHHLMLVLLFYAVAGSTGISDSKKLVALLAGIACVLSISNIVYFIDLGGMSRVFGLAKTHFSGLLTLTMVYLIARICLETQRTRAAIYALLFVLVSLSQIANQSRGAIVMSIVGVAIAMAIAWRWGSINSQSLPRLRVLQLITASICLLSLVVTLNPHLFAGVYSRFEGYGAAALNLNARLFLWKTALVAYLENPILGIGLGQVGVWHNIFPAVHLSPLGPMTIGMTAHNSFLGYLAQTGTLGIIPLLWLFIRIAGTGKGIFRRVKSSPQAGHLLGLWAIALIIIVRAFFEDDVFHSIAGTTTVLFFGLLVSVSKEIASPRHGNEDERIGT